MSRQLSQRIAFTLITLVAGLVILPIMAIIVYIAIEGLGAISWSFLTEMPHDGMKAGGLLPAIVGTLALTIGTAIVAVPIGMGGAIYLSEYAKDNASTRAIRIAIINLAGIPSSLSTASSAWACSSSSSISARRSWRGH